MKGTVLAFAALIALAGMPIAANAQNGEPIAYWNFNTFDPATAVTIPADVGSGTLSLAGWGGGVANFAGTTINALGGDPAGASLSLQGGAAVNDVFPGNGTFIELQFSMAGLSDLGISFATRGTSSGFDMGQWSYSTDGANFTNFGPNTATRDTSFGLVGPFTTSALDNVANAYLRYTLDGATSSAGNNRIDNLLLESGAVEPPPPPPPPPVTVPQPGDIVFGLNSNAQRTLELVRGPAQAGGGEALGSPWTQTPFIQSVSYDSLDGTRHNVRGNLLGLDFGTTTIPGKILSFGTNVAPAPPGQLIGDTAGLGGTLVDSVDSRLAGISVSPDNSKIAVAAYDSGRVLVYDYAPGETLSGARETQQIFDAERTQGTIWLDANTVLSFATFGQLYSIDAGSMAVTPLTSVAEVFGATFTSLAYNPDVSDFLYASLSAFSGGVTTNKLYIFDPTNSFVLLNEVDFSESSETAREIALDADGNLFISTFDSRIDVILDVVSNPGAIADNSSINWYNSLTSESFSGIDIGFGEELDVPTLPGDFNMDGVVDAADYTVWRDGLGTDFTPEQFEEWKANFGATLASGSAVGTAAVPEPASVVLLLLGTLGLLGRRGVRR